MLAAERVLIRMPDPQRRPMLILMLAERAPILMPRR
jgi:hypothetical protein